MRDTALSATTKVSNDLEIKVDIKDVVLGMYVTSLDVPWSQTRFMLEGLLLSNEKQMEELRRHCAWVIVSIEKSKEGVVRRPNIQIKKPENNKSREIKEDFFSLLNSGINSIASEILSILRIFTLNPMREASVEPVIHRNKASVDQAIKEDYSKMLKAKVIRTQFKNDDAVTNSLVNHITTHSINSEVKSAQIAQNNLINITSTLSLASDLSQSQLHESIDVAKDALSAVVDSVSRNPDAMQLMTKIKSLDEDSYQHAIDVSLLMIALGRELCLPKNDLIEIGLGGLLHDVGEIKVPHGDGLKRIKNITKFKIYKEEHVQEGLKIAIKANHSAIVRQIIENHHEYYDGSGYPKGREKGQIGFYGNMAVIVDTYVSYTTGRCSDVSMTPSQALSIMYRQKGKMFHPQILDQFIQIIGLYPVGSLVQLSSGNIALVIKQNKLWRLKPVVMVIMDKNKQKLKKTVTVDLMEEEQNKKKPLIIKRELSMDNFDIKPEDYF